MHKGTRHVTPWHPFHRKQVMCTYGRDVYLYGRVCTYRRVVPIEGCVPYGRVCTYRRVCTYGRDVYLQNWCESVPMSISVPHNICTVV